MSIRRKIELILDRAAAKRAEQQTQESLDKGTDPRKPTQNLDKVGGSMDRLRGIAVKLGTALAGMWIVKKVWDYSKAVFQLGADVRAVGSQFRTVFGDSSGNMQSWLDDFRRVAGLTRREAQKLSASSGSMAQGFGMSEEAAADFAQQVLTVSGDLASFNNIKTAEAAQLVGSALIGNTEAARSLQVSFTALDVQQRAMANTGKKNAAALTQAEKAMAALQVITERAGPQIGDLARTQNDADNQAKQLAASYTQLKESLAAAVVGGTAGSTIFADIRDIFEDATRWVEANSAEIGFWSSLTIDAARAVGGTVMGIFNLIGSVAGSISSYVVLTVRVWQEAFARGADGVSTVINGIITGLNHLPGVDIDFRIAGMDVAHFENMRKAATEDLTAELGGVADALVQVGEGWVQVGRKALTADRAQRQAAGGGGSDTGAGSGLQIPGVARRDMSARVRIPHDVVDDAKWIRTELDKVGMFEGLIEQADLTATFMREGFAGVGAAIVSQLIEGRAEAEFASGLAALAAGTWPPNPAALAAAGKHFAAAAAFKTLGATLGSAFGGGGGAGGGAGAPAPGGALGTSTPGITNPAGSELHIYLDPLSANNPEFQRVVHGAGQNASERYGGKVRVHHHSRSGR